MYSGLFFIKIFELLQLVGCDFYLPVIPIRIWIEQLCCAENKIKAYNMHDKKSSQTILVRNCGCHTAASC
jgi:hypothetical protein